MAAKSAGSKPTNLKTILERLVRPTYTVPKREEGESALERLMALCIQGDSSYTAAQKAVRALKREYAHWNEVRVARRFEVRALFQQKRIGDAANRAERVQEFLRRVFGLQNHLDLDWLYDATSERREKLLDALTMAPDHAGPVLDLDAALADGEPVPPITTDLKRLTARLGLFPSNPRDAQVREVVEPATRGEDLFPHDLALKSHARVICQSKHPRCRQCVLLDLCPHGQRLLGKEHTEAALEEMGLGKPKRAKNKAAKRGTKKKATRKKATRKKATRRKTTRRKSTRR